MKDKEGKKNAIRPEDLRREGALKCASMKRVKAKKCLSVSG